MALEMWEKMWQMKFHPEKCQVIRIHTNKRFERQSNYKLHGHTLEVVLFVCFVALRPKSTAMVIAGRPAHLTILLPGQA